MVVARRGGGGAVPVGPVGRAGGWGRAAVAARGGPGAGAAMALNLSKNGRALQEAYGRVVAAGSPTDW